MKGVCVVGLSLLFLALVDLGSAEADIMQLVIDHAPYLRFDLKQGEGNLCFPHNAQEFYEARKGGDWSRKCNRDYDSVTRGSIPTYWHANTCGYHLHIAYWNFYGYNDDCDCCSGERDAWWEFIVVKIRDWTLNPRMHEVMFGQKKGWYTRIPGHYETFNTTHPVAYVGKSNHGTYHDDGGTGTCCYYEDFRNPGSADKHMVTWDNLIHLREEEGEDWMTDPNTDWWHGLQSPIFRDDWDVCGLMGCTGSSLQVCGTCGCHKSDIGEDPF
ncbi:uncharacterized protein LOC123499215 [Portunus trituberculatus]|uniref:uncharacterized protein LOC123499215 n=1 Tax=Portunus trituberculatus TaxID=210409 RepID=UPI001E1CEE9F|nr:uncharacterized protein LOC123499215 [Portunus trituberculatus]